MRETRRSQGIGAFRERFRTVEMDPVLLSGSTVEMRILWALPLLLLAGAGLVARLRRRSDSDRTLTSEPVSGQWLAEARSREDHPW